MNNILTEVKIAGKKWLIRTAFALLFANTLSLIAWKLYQTIPEPKVMAKQETIREIPPIMQKICKAESGCSHYDKNGQVLINRTMDAGKYQINVSVWGKKATEMGIDLFSEKGNEQFALYLFENYGTEPWNSSKKNWK